jgi:hypothetical protein
MALGQQSIARPGSGGVASGASSAPTLGAGVVGARRPRRRAPGEGSLLWELRQIHKQLECLEERVGDLYARALAAARRGAAAAQPPRAVTASDAVATACVVPAPRSAAAKPCCTSVVAKPCADGSVWVRVEGSRPFLLPPHLGVLWLVLAEDTGLSRDEAVAFKSLRDLSVRIGKRAGGRGPSPGTINKYVCRLRRWLAARGVDPSIVQTNRRLGRRLAIRRGVSGER